MTLDVSKTETPTDTLQSRFGSAIYFEDSFHELDRSNMSKSFQEFHNDKQKVDKYEIKRQNFLKLLDSGNRMRWHSTNQDYDMNVDISRIYRRDREEYVAFMRIQPDGFRAERMIPAGVEIIFHVIMGSVLFQNKARIRTMQRGHYTLVQPKSSYSIRCQTKDQPSILIFQIKKKKQSTSRSSQMPPVSEE